MRRFRCVHMSSVHFYSDVRILRKECRSLAEAGYDVVLIAPCEKDLTVDGISVQAVPEVAARLRRMTQVVWMVYRKAMCNHADIYHFHDPELMPIALLLKWRGKRVIYDVHEDLPRQLVTKDWLPNWSRGLLGYIIERLETWAAGKLDGIVTATPTIARRFPANKTYIIYNYPRIEEFNINDASSYADRPASVTYVGGISWLRGIKEMMLAVSLLPAEANVRLKVAGWYDVPGFESELPSIPGYDRTDILGCLSREGVADLLSQVRVGLVVIHPTENYIDSLPVKLFEYMAAGIPVIASDFPLWREIVDSATCGLLVDPLDPRAIADAIQWLLDHPDEAAEMGRRGREAVLTRFNWKSEEQKLLSIYRELLCGADASADKTKSHAVVDS